jgi:NAD(P)-dependent dehydrogenase (short-subunit alcohol dehydrogenase family)
MAVKGMTIMLTGATGGIGRETARALARRGACLIVHGRDAEKVQRLCRELSAEGAEVSGAVANLSSLEETARLGREAIRSPKPVEVLINNAGTGFGRDGTRRETSVDGHELRFAVNYLAPFLLAETLLAEGLPRRAVINVASAGQEPLDFDDLMTGGGYSGVRAYRRSKIALVMMSIDLAALHPDLQVLSLHPGTFLDTQMVRDAGISPLGPAARGSDSILAVLEEALRGGESGRYFDQSRPARALPQAYDEEARRRLREETLRIVSRFLPGKAAARQPQ